MNTEPGLRFWLEYVERRGALREEDADRTLVLLTPELQRVLDLSESVSVTSDPEVAAEDGSLLMIAGHPAVDAAARAVLHAGDAGYAHLPWPRSAAPDGPTLLAKAREAFAIDHGRIDPQGAPVGAYLPVLRVGALVTYTLSDRFQEREEVWIDGLNGLPLPDPLRSRIETAPAEDGARTPHPALAPDVLAALRAAHGALSRRAEARGVELARQVSGSQRDEIARAEAYYADALASIARRREGAPAERQALLDAQAEAVRAEAARRRQEIEEKFRPRHEIEPFRLHLLLVPGAWLPLEVRRGERRYPFGLAWFSYGACFGDVRCPHCGERAPLVAGRAYLGCTRCLARPATPAASPIGPTAVRGGNGTEPEAAPRPPGSATTNNREVTDGAGGTAAGGDGALTAADTSRPHAGPLARGPRSGAAGVDGPGPAHDAGGAGPHSRAAGADGPAPRHRASAAGRSTPRSEAAGSDGPAPTPARGAMGVEALAGVAEVRRAANDLAARFFTAAVHRRPWSAAEVAPDSPLAALYRLYGPAGPLRAVGLPLAPPPARISAQSRLPAMPGEPCATGGSLEVGAHQFPYTILWWLVRGRAVLQEVLPFDPVAGSRLPPATALSPMAIRALYQGRPRPLAHLDPVASVLWEVGVPQDGLPLVVRCLAAWWRAGAPDARWAGRPEAAAAALVWLVAQGTGVRRTQAATALAYGVDAAAMKARVAAVRALLVAREA